MLLAAILLFWFGCGFYAFGTLMANEMWEAQYLPRKRTSRDALGVCAGLSLFGPIGALWAAFLTNFNQHGWGTVEQGALTTPPIP